MSIYMHGKKNIWVVLRKSDFDFQDAFRTRAQARKKYGPGYCIMRITNYDVYLSNNRLRGFTK
jgi:hypothetical protein